MMTGSHFSQPADSPTGPRRSLNVSDLIAARHRPSRYRMHPPNTTALLGGEYIMPGWARAPSKSAREVASRSKRTGTRAASHWGRNAHRAGRAGPGQRAGIDRDLGALENRLARSMCSVMRRRRGLSGEADVQGEVPEPQVEYSAAGPVHNERQQDDGQDYDDHPEEEHDDAGKGIPRYSSRSSHDCPATRRRLAYSAYSAGIGLPLCRDWDHRLPAQ